MKTYENTHLNIKSWAEEDRPREKLLIKGKAALSDAELLGILIATGIQNMTAIDIAKVILQSVNNDLNQLARLSVKDLAKFKGIGEAKAITIVSALELGRRKKNTEKTERPRIRCSADAYEVLKPYLTDLQHEEFWVILLNRANDVMKCERVSSGGVSGTIADPKMIFKVALEHLASGIILSHNHPSGNLSPSQVDKDLTQKLRAGGQHLDIPVLDHLIFTDKKYFSFADEGML
ncbi:MULTISPECIES: RadC family protein [unclassified Arcicella]|uniref:RadC family protein n=1 Tax=unclassified Arcicella TaxID=2644986 RepID=UPI00285682B1|nr:MULTISPECIES: DNA repair protein RadC [unclassified Arcicella]MDR6562973.1 DNA repair protein RadC [Arcicella sp. BE51]MDR6813057.1 DNA repair protein RadC [Arcicella sp. BE140]MDR6824371.1 DNA repair protein RadC [Arcicella sp. BE139]